MYDLHAACDEVFGEVAVARNPAAQVDDEGLGRLFEQGCGHHGGRLATAACDSFGDGTIVIDIVLSACELQLRRMIFVCWRHSLSPCKCMSCADGGVGDAWYGAGGVAVGAG
eukprot:3634043-Pleurochrysis_carterae.AAC.1